jgi:NitT/TauT family transport system substrate-binding protein
LAVVRLVRWPPASHPAEGEVLELLGQAGDPQADLLAIIRHFGLEEQFPPDVLERAYTSQYLDQSSDPNTKGVQHFADVMLASGFIDKAPDLKHGIVLQHYARALDSLAKESPNDPFWKNLQAEFKQKND